MTFDLWRITMFVLDVLIVIAIISGLFYLKKYLDAHKDETAKDKEEKIKRIIRTNGIIIALLGFIALSIGAFTKLI